MRIIEEFLVENNLEDEAISLIPTLLQRKKEKAEKAIDYARTWAPALQDAANFVWDKDVAKLLNKLQLFAALSLPLDGAPKLLDTAREVIPKIKVPKVFFLPTISYLEQYGIHFADEDSILMKAQRIEYPFKLTK